MIASHYAAAGDQPAALRATRPRATLAARRCTPTPRSPTSPNARSSCGRASPRTRDLTSSITSICWRWRRGAYGDRRRPRRARRCCSGARSRSSIPSATRSATRRCSARLSRVQWSLNRGQGVETAERALALLPRGGGPRAGAAAGLAGADARPARALPRCDRRRRGGARRPRSRPATRSPSAR